MKIKIVTLSDKNRKEISDVTFPTLEKFSINTGIELTRHTSLIDPSIHAKWNKFLSLKLEIEKYDWIIWMDSDISIINKNFDLKNYLSTFDKRTNFLISMDCNGPCTGCFALRNCEWSYNFINTVLFLKNTCDIKEVPQNRTESDQGCVRVLIKNFSNISNYVEYIPEHLIQNPRSVFNPDAFAMHFWYELRDRNRIIDCATDIDNGIWTEEQLKSKQKNTIVVM